MLYIRDDLDCISMEKYNKLYSQMSEQRKAYAECFWTKKECYLKMIGLGVYANIKEALRRDAVENSRFTIIINERKQYVCCCEIGREDV